MKKTFLPSVAQLGCFALISGLAGLPLGATAMDTSAVPGFDVGGGVGTNSLNGSDYTGNGNDVDSRQVSFKALVGYRFHPVVSLEAQYVDFGTAESGNNRVKAHGITVGGVFEAPITRFVHPYGKVGVLFWDADGEFSNVQRSDTGNDFTYGAGARFVLGRNFDARAEYERFEFGDNTVGTLSAMLQYNF